MELTASLDFKIERRLPLFWPIHELFFSYGPASPFSPSFYSQCLDFNHLVTAAVAPTLLALTVSSLVWSHTPLLATVVPATAHKKSEKRKAWFCGTKIYLLPPPLLPARLPPPTSVQLSPSLARRFLLEIETIYLLIPTTNHNYRDITNLTDCYSCESCGKCRLQDRVCSL